MSANDSTGLTDQQVIALSRLLSVVAVDDVPPVALLAVADRLGIGPAFRLARAPPPNRDNARPPTYQSSHRPTRSIPSSRKDIP